MAHVNTVSSIRRLPKTPCTTTLQKPYNTLRRPRSSHQTRGLWRCSHQIYDHDRRRKNIQIILNKRQRLRRPPQPPREQRTIYPDCHYQSWQNPGWGWSSSRSGFLESKPRPRRGDGDSWEDRAQQRMERIKKEIEADPYAALFGRRLGPYNGWGSGFKLENGFTALCRSFFGLDRSEKDTGVAAGRGKGDYSIDHSTSNGEVWEPQPERVQSQSSPESGYEFDPVSGRMVPKRSLETSEEEGKERHATNGQSEEPKPGSKVDSSSSVEESETNPRGLSGSGIVDSSNQGEQTIPEAPREPNDTSESLTASQDQPSFFTRIKETSDNVPEPPEGFREAVRAESSQLYDQTEQSTPPDNNNCLVLPKETAQPSQNFDVENRGVPQKSTAEHHEPEEGLDRVGFLSRRDNKASTSATSGTIRAQPVIDDRDEHLDSLRARDIRAAYDSRRLSIESEIESEASKTLSEPSPPYMVDVDHHSKYPASQYEDPSPLPSETPISTASSSTDKQARAGTPSQNEGPVIMSKGAEVYRIFAYDPSSLKVMEAETISSLKAPNKHLHPTKVLARLTNPAKFLPCLNQMHSEGYEIVSGGGDILVFRKAPKTRNATASPSQMKDDQKSTIEEHPEEAAIPQPAHDAFYTGNLSDHRSSAGQSHKRSPKSKIRTALRRMFISGAATAGTCYALGVVSEYFRTGGEHGWGIDGFTEFESERRHRE
ncbi:hypothetical protein BDW62DRAFT_60350 [Aspergillus aurantiobrunneus]